MKTDAGPRHEPAPRGAATEGVDAPRGCVLAVCTASAHRFSKVPQNAVRLLVGLGVEGDAHCGATVRHRSRVAQDPSQPNLRQVHLIQAELFAELALAGHEVAPGGLGENLTTQGIDLLALPAGTRLVFGGRGADGDDAAPVVELTGLRNPCHQIEAFRPGLLAAVLARTPDGRLVRKAGVMGVVRHGGIVRPGDALQAVLPALPHRALERV